MAKSIRTSDELYELASSTSTLMHRSLAQQIEHWAALGRALEARGSKDEVLAAALEHMHDLDRRSVASGRMKASALHAIEPVRARRMQYKLHAKALAAFDVNR